MPRLSKKTKLIREVARNAAEEMAAEGDRVILDAAEELAGKVRYLSVDGALEVLFCAVFHDMQHDGGADEAAAVSEALDRYSREASDD